MQSSTCWMRARPRIGENSDSIIGLSPLMARGSLHFLKVNTGGRTRRSRYSKSERWFVTLR